MTSVIIAESNHKNLEINSTLSSFWCWFLPFSEIHLIVVFLVVWVLWMVLGIYIVVIRLPCIVTGGHLASICLPVGLSVVVLLSVNRLTDDKFLFFVHFFLLIGNFHILGPSRLFGFENFFAHFVDGLGDGVILNAESFKNVIKFVIAEQIAVH